MINPIFEHILISGTSPSILVKLFVLPYTLKTEMVKTTQDKNLRNVNHSIANEKHPRYLSIKIVRSLTYKQHLEGVKNKTKTKNNIIVKLASTSWGANVAVLRSSAIALVYSVAEYCAPVWAVTYL